jgi:predicted RecA/RadA family phage recombinase
MSTRFNKVLAGLVLLTVFLADIPLSSITTALETLLQGQGTIVDRLYLARQNSNVVDNFGLAPKQAHAAVDPAELEYFAAIGPITGTASANYAYGTLFNPSGSGRTISVKRVVVKTNAVAVGNFVNVAVRRISAASAGTQIASAQIPKKNSDSATSIAEVRHTGPTVTYSNATQSRLLGLPLTAAVGYEYSYREIVFDESQEALILQPGEGIALYQEAAGTTNLRVTLYVEWEETVSAPTAQNEYMVAIQRVEVAATAGYVYNSFFNPAASGKTAIVRRVWFGSETCDTAAIYTNNLIVKRISAASGGTQIAVANIPKKHTGSSNSAMEIRYTGVTVTQVGGTDARLGNVTPCGATGEVNGWQSYDFHPNDEQLILKPGEGIALISETAGDIDQLNRMFIEWQEVVVASTPTAANEYLWASSRVEVAAALGTSFYTLFNPVASGKTAKMKRLVIRVNADGAAAYSTFNFQRISAASGGTLIGASDIPKKHTSSTNSGIEVRWCGAACASAITTTYVGSRSIVASTPSDSGLMKALGPGAVSQVHGQFELTFTPEETLVLKEGEGIGLYLNYLAGNVNHYVKMAAEWEEVTVAPTTQNQYMIDIGALPGSTGATNNYATFFNPSASGKTAIIKRTAVRANAVAAATYTALQVRRISAASGGTQIAAANIPKKNTSTADSAMEIRRTGVTATYSQTTDAQFIAVQTPGAVAAATAIAQNAWRALSFENDEAIVLQPGEGIVLDQTAAADVDHRLFWYLEWEEVASTSTPPSEGEYLMTIGPVTGSTAAEYVYATVFNPSTSGKLLVMNRLGIRADRTGTLVAPGYMPITVRPISAATGGTAVTAANFPKKHSSTTASSAEVRRTGVTATYSLATSSRFMTSIAPGAVRNMSGILEQEFISGDALVLYPGEGVALYQESTAGDALVRYHLTAQWSEVDAPVPPQSLTFSLSDNSIGFGTLLPGGTRYATGDGTGSGVDVADAHTLTVSTNATDGYVVYITGNTLTCSLCGGATISAVGASAAAPTVGVEQFGVRLATNSGTGIPAAPYNSSNWALDTAAFPDVVASGAGDEVSTIYGARYMSNIASNSEPGSYTANLTYVVTASF